MQGLVAVSLTQPGIVLRALIARADVKRRRHDVQHASKWPGVSRENEGEEEGVLY